jgi:hypothetical protein
VKKLLVSLNKELLGLDKEDSSGTLGQIDIAKHLLDIKTNMEEAQAEISQIKQADIAQIDRWLVKPNLQLQSIISEDRRIEERLPQLENKLYIFEANNLTESSRLVAQFVGRCIKCIEQGKGSTSGNNDTICVHYLFWS